MSPHPDVAALAGELLPYALAYKTGSHQFGLNTPDSDIDWTVIYHHAEDHRRLFRRYPDVTHSQDNDHKLYSLRKLGEMTLKGNPNVVELLANLDCEPVDYPYNGQGTVILGFAEHVRPSLVTRQLAAAYLGHLQGLRKEIDKQGITAKRLSHAIRMADCAELLLLTGQVPDYRQMPGRETALAIKTGRVPLHQGLQLLDNLETDLGPLYLRGKENLPDGSALQAAINDFFVGLPAHPTGCAL